MGLNVFMLFVGFGLGSLVFSLFLRFGDLDRTSRVRDSGFDRYLNRDSPIPQ